jgi:hypothetical protein
MCPSGRLVFSSICCYDVKLELGLVVVFFCVRKGMGAFHLFLLLQCKTLYISCFYVKQEAYEQEDEEAQIFLLFFVAMTQSKAWEFRLTIPTSNFLKIILHFFLLFLCGLCGVQL